MSVEVSWLDTNRRILHYCFTGNWNWDEYFNALAAGRDMQKQVGHMTCLINNLSQTQYLPDDFIEQARSIRLTRPLNLGISVYVSTDYHFREIHTILNRLYPENSHRYALAATLEEALEIIAAWFAEHDKSGG